MKLRLVYLHYLRKSGLRCLSCLMLGLLIGASFTNLFIGSRIDQLSSDRDNLLHNLADCKSEVAELTDSLQKKRQVITSIEPQIVFEDDTLTSYDIVDYSLSIAKTVKKLLEPLVGQDLESISYQLVPKMIDERIIRIDDKNFILSVHTITFTPKVFLSIRVKRYN